MGPGYLEDPVVDHVVDGGVLLGDLAELGKGKVFLCGEVAEDPSEHHRLEAEGLGQLAAGGRLPRSGRAADGNPHSDSTFLTSRSSFLRSFLRKMNLISLFSICPMGRLTMV